MKIWKQKLEIIDYQGVEFPADAKILTAQIQCGALCVWYTTSGDCDKMEIRKFRIAETGHDDNWGDYITTFQIDSGRLVYHLFEITWVIV